MVKRFKLHDVCTGNYMHPILMPHTHNNMCASHEVLILSNQVVIVTPAFVILLILHLIDYQRRNEIGFATSLCLSGHPFTFPTGVSK